MTLLNNLNIFLLGTLFGVLIRILKEIWDFAKERKLELIAEMKENTN